MWLQALWPCRDFFIAPTPPRRLAETAYSIRVCSCLSESFTKTDFPKPSVGVKPGPREEAPGTPLGCGEKSRCPARGQRTGPPPLSPWSQGPTWDTFGSRSSWGAVGVAREAFGLEAGGPGSAWLGRRLPEANGRFPFASFSVAPACHTSLPAAPLSSLRVIRGSAQVAVL